MSEINIDSLIKAKRIMDEAAVPLRGRSQTLLASDFPKEFKKGTRMILGVNIIWLNDLDE